MSSGQAGENMKGFDPPKSWTLLGQGKSLQKRFKELEAAWGSFLRSSDKLLSDWLTKRLTEPFRQMESWTERMKLISFNCCSQSVLLGAPVMTACRLLNHSLGFYVVLSLWNSLSKCRPALRKLPVEAKHSQLEPHHQGGGAALLLCPKSEELRSYQNKAATKRVYQW